MIRFRKLVIAKDYFWALISWVKDRIYKCDCKLHWKRCPICGHWTLDYNYICPVCHWEYEWEYEDKNNYNLPCYTNGNLNVYEYREFAKKNLGIKIKDTK